ncbi:hypothetical protein EG827_04390 [bacterium]|nr:hypothetical protein [bacterium]
MKPARLISAAILFLALMPSGSGQDTTQPLSPGLDMVTVDPQTGFATVRWTLSASPDVAGYVIYTFSSGTANAIDTVRSTVETEYIHTSSLAGYMSVTYVVAAIDSSLNISPLSNALSTIFLTAVNDTCNSRITLSWTPYINSSHPAEGYEIGVSVGNESPVMLETVPLSETTYIYTDYDPGTSYCFHITSFAGGAGLSSSNRVCVTTGSETAPSWVNIDALAVAGGAMVFNGSYDQATSVRNFALQKYNPVISSWETIANAAGSAGNVTLTVPGADTANVNLYRITALNNCSLPVTSSDAVRNMVLLSAVTGTRIELKWNNPFPAGEALFTVWRESGQGWTEVATHLSDTIWTDDYSLFATEISGEEVAYQVYATEADAAAGSPYHRSSVTAVQAAFNIFVPNAFIPDSGTENEIFMPEFAFVPVNYDFRIYTRTGVLLFQTTDYATGWDGRQNGTLLPSGVYLWSLRLTTPSGSMEVMTGTVTILP